jgi:outer membrane protein
VLRAEVEVSNAELAVIDAEDRRRVAQGVLNTLMGQPPEQDLELAAPAAPVVNPAEIPLADAVARALAQRPETQSAAARMDATRARISQAKSAFGPRLTGEGMFGWHDDEFAPSDQEWALGMSIRIPIFTGFANENRLGKAKAEFNQAEAEAAGLGLAIRREVWTAYSMLQRNYAAVMTADVQAQQAAESLRLARERYALGAGTITDLLDAQTALTRAESLQARTRWEYHVARSEFRRVTAAVNVPAASAP